MRVLKAIFQAVIWPFSRGLVIGTPLVLIVFMFNSPDVAQAFGKLLILDNYKEALAFALPVGFLSFVMANANGESVESVDPGGMSVADGSQHVNLINGAPLMNPGGGHIGVDIHNNVQGSAFKD